MSRNDSAVRYRDMPGQVKIPRSTFKLDTQNSFSMDSGKLIPFYLEEVYPGDHFSIKESSMAIESTPLFDVISNAYLDTYYFFVPSRTLWSKFRNMMGENPNGPWIDNATYAVPMLTKKFKEIGVGDYLGIPTKTPSPLAVSALPLRAYRLIWNYWFRDENLQGPKVVNLGDSENDQTLDDLLPVCKIHDFFTSCLPDPQKGDPVPIITPTAAIAPVNTGFNRTPPLSPSLPLKFGGDNETSSPSDHYMVLSGEEGSSVYTAYLDSDNPPISTGNLYSPLNLWADLSGSTATMADLYLASAMQRYLYIKAMGSRFNESIKGQFDITSPNLELDIPEYLGGNNTRINMSGVVQTSSTDTTSPQGHLTGFSKTHGNGFISEKAFSEWGYVLGVCCIRPEQVYQQGLRRLWSRKLVTDFYLPVFAHLGERAVQRKEIYATGVVDDDNKIFGYQQQWEELRVHPKIVTGRLRSNATGSMDFVHYANNFSAPPVLNEDFIIQSKNPIARTIADTDILEGQQFLVQINTFNMASREVPVFSTPGITGTF